MEFIEAVRANDVAKENIEEKGNRKREPKLFWYTQQTSNSPLWEISNLRVKNSVNPIICSQTIINLWPLLIICIFPRSPPLIILKQISRSWDHNLCLYDSKFCVLYTTPSLLDEASSNLYLNIFRDRRHAVH